MIRGLADWFDHRTGFRRLLAATLYEPVPGGARWRYVWGSTLVFTFLVQVVTGFALWMAYSPGVQNAWASVLYIEESLWWGWLVRGIHHFTAQAMVVLLALHFLQVIWAGAYRAPREINFWLGLLLAQIVLALALTGYLLPWDQKGYYATQVATKIVGAIPLIGPAVQELIQGGTDYGQQTLTRFFALHAGLLPTLLVLVLVVHLLLFRRHGVTTPPNATNFQGWFWPDQVWRDAVACCGVLGIVLLLASIRGAELSAPADVAEPFAAARPEWYFLSLFRLLKFEWVEQWGLAFGAVVIPGMVAGLVTLMPFIAKVRGGHWFNVVAAGGLTLVIVGLTGLAWYEDRQDVDHQAALREAARDGARARQLALRPTRVPLEGPARLLGDDPLSQGPRIFATHCGSCHHYRGHDGRGRALRELDSRTVQLVAAQPTAPDLGDLGSHRWMRSILVSFEDHFATLKNAAWFGDAEGIDPDESEMVDWSGDRESLLAPDNADNLKAVVEFLVAEAGHAQTKTDPGLVARGRTLATQGGWEGDISASCVDCHETIGQKFDPDREGESGYPDLAEYLSAKWLRDFLTDPGQSQHYGEKNQMPAFRERLSATEMDLLIDWLTHDYLPADWTNEERPDPDHAN